MRKCKHENCNGDCTRTECGGKCNDIPNCEIKKYKQALEEIRGIAKTVISASNCSNCDGVGYYDGCLDDHCGDYAIRKIADKIDEVLR